MVGSLGGRAPEVVPRCSPASAAAVRPPSTPSGRAEPAATGRLDGAITIESAEESLRACRQRANADARQPPARARARAAADDATARAERLEALFGRDIPYLLMPTI